jgi:hypothetical protein
MAQVRRTPRELLLLPPQRVKPEAMLEGIVPDNAIQVMPSPRGNSDAYSGSPSIQVVASTMGFERCNIFNAHEVQNALLLRTRTTLKAIHARIREAHGLHFSAA